MVVAFGPNNDPGTYASTNSMVVGDRGLVVREFRSTLNGVAQKAPTFSVLCDKIEIGTPKDVLRLQKGDFFEAKLEILVLPRAGDEFAKAKESISSKTLNTKLGPLATTWERVRAQAEGGQLTVTPVVGTRVESHYPVRVARVGPSNPKTGVHANVTVMKFEVAGSALGFVPITISGLVSPKVASEHGLWMKKLSQPSSSFRLLTDSLTSLNVLWQTNYDRTTSTYDIVFNVEVLEDTTFAFGGIDATIAMAMCTTGSTFNVATGAAPCAACATCETGVKTACTATADTVCTALCTAGSTFNVATGAAPCAACTTCTTGIATACNIQADTVCNVRFIATPRFVT